MFRFCIGIPLERFVPMLVCEKTSVLSGPPNFRANALGPGFGITVFTAGRNFGATPPRIKRVVCPFD